jgi:hypothetical protein
VIDLVGDKVDGDSADLLRPVAAPVLEGRGAVVADNVMPRIRAPPGRTIVATLTR